MRSLIGLAARSAFNRRPILAFTIAAFALTTFLLLGVNQVRRDFHESFLQSVTGTDLVVGARAGSLQLLLYALFHVGEATQNMRWDSAQRIAEHPAVAWSIPLSLGDTHLGFPVLATTDAYFEHFQYGNRRFLHLAQGRKFSDVFEAVLGSEVAAHLHYSIGQSITLTHGAVSMPGAEHADKPFLVVGILAPTGTAVDRTVHISLAGMEAIHLDWQAGAPVPGLHITEQMARKFDLTPKTITAQLLGLKRRSDVFAMQRVVADFPDEALMGVMPGVALDQLWRMSEQGERILTGLSWVVAVVALGGMVTTMLVAIQSRRRELAILRAVGASFLQIILLLSLESILICTIGVLVGTLALAGVLPLLADWAQVHYGLIVQGLHLKAQDWVWLGVLLAVTMIAGTLPGIQAWRISLSDGLTPRM